MYCTFLLPDILEELGELFLTGMTSLQDVAKINEILKKTKLCEDKINKNWKKKKQ